MVLVEVFQAAAVRLVDGNSSKFWREPSVKSLRHFTDQNSEYYQKIIGRFFDSRIVGASLVGALKMKH